MGRACVTIKLQDLIVKTSQRRPVGVWLMGRVQGRVLNVNLEREREEGAGPRHKALQPCYYFHYDQIPILT